MTPNPIYNDETLMRRIDGELSPEAGAAIDRATVADPALAARLDAQRRLRTLARGALPVAPDQRDKDLVRLIATGGAGPRRAAVAGLTDRLRAAFAPRHTPIWVGIAAACFLLGLSLGGLGGGQDPGGLLDERGGIADAGLIKVLGTGLTADGPDREGRAVGLTFRDGDDRWCRTFRSGQAGMAGLACREDDRWTIRALAPAGADGGDGGDLRTAAADIPAPVLAAVDAAIAGETLDAAAEVRARDAGWR